MTRLRAWAKALKLDLLALYLAMQHPATPWYARLMAVIVVGYAFSPIDLIPDFIPVLGYLDDLLLLPLGIYITVRLIPAALWAECRERACTQADAAHPHGYIATVIIVILWLVLLGLGLRYVLEISGAAPL